ncbi:hypothetical protein P4S64_07815 [Vibrio sp. M60_M31a]
MSTSPLSKIDEPAKPIVVTPIESQPIGFFAYGIDNIDAVAIARVAVGVDVIRNHQSIVL